MTVLSGESASTAAAQMAANTIAVAATIQAMRRERTAATNRSRSQLSASAKYAFRPSSLSFTPIAISAARTCGWQRRSEEHTSELQSLMRNSYAVFCLKKTNDIKLEK